MFIKPGLFFIVHKLPGEALNSMLTNVTKSFKIQQLIGFTCFIIHVDSNCVGERTYAWRAARYIQTVCKLYELCSIVFQTKQPVQSTAHEFAGKPKGYAYHKAKTKNGEVPCKLPQAPALQNGKLNCRK